jgi:hypothetical protein
MAAGEVRFSFHDGETLTIAGEDVPRVYENLWQLAARPGAVSLAGMVMAASRQPPAARVPVLLTEPQGAVIREALSMPAPDPETG